MWHCAGRRVSAAEIWRYEMEGVPRLQSAGRGRRPPGPARRAEGGEGKSARGGIGDRPRHDLRLRANDRPDIGGKDDHRDISAGEILLVCEILITGDEGIEACLLGFVEQLPIGVARPAHLEGCADVVTGEHAAQGSRRIFVQQNSHPLEGGMMLA